MIKIRYNGKLIKPRNKKGQFTKNLKPFLLKSFLVFTLLVTTVYGTLYLTAQPVQYTKASVVVEEKIDSKIIAIMKRDVVEMVRWAEVSREVEAGELFYTNDPHSSISSECKRIGGKRGIACDSWSIMQFKLPTIQFYYKKLYEIELTEKEALMVALDDERAMALAEDIIFKVEGGIYEWAGAEKNRAYFNKQIPFIRSLEENL